ncbi:MAG: hypothetical protein IKD73_05185 [Selenomonadaceae bacterium]|nr:hypothetical protein [Selenomonadaceae bacterium]
MGKKFYILALLFSFLLMAFVITFGFKSMSGIKDGNSSIPTLNTIEKYGNKAMAMIKGFTYPILEKLGIDTRIDPRETVKHELERATSAVNDATKELTR